MRIANMVISVVLLALALGVCAGASGQPVPRSSTAELLGAGPAAKLGLLSSGLDFDKAYMDAMFQQHADILVLATVGGQISTSDSLRDFYGKIRSEQADQNKRLTQWCVLGALGSSLTANSDRVKAILNSLPSVKGKTSSAALADATIILLCQSKEASDLAQSKAFMPEVRDQAKIVSKAAVNEIAALQLWKKTGFLSAGEQRRFSERHIYR